MAINEYHFVTHWRMQGRAKDVYAILSNPRMYPSWWPEVFLKVDKRIQKSGGSAQPVVGILSRGWLPYKLRWEARVLEATPPCSFTLEASGDFSGRGTWTLYQDGPFVNITYDWNVRANKPFLRYFSFFLKPIFVANHAWAMRRGEEGLREELVRIEAERNPAFDSKAEPGWMARAANSFWMAPSLGVA